MNLGLVNSLKKQDRLLVAETERSALLTLSEDDLVELHTRVRRARNKYVSVHRREASAKVGKQRARGTAAPKNQRNAERVEVFEDALARVSRQLAVVAARSATELRRERLATARAAKASQPQTRPSRAAARAAATGTPARSEPTARAGDRGLVSPTSRKKAASTKAAGARRQAKRDSR